MSSIVDSYAPMYSSFNNNGYLIDKKLNSVQNEVRLQRSDAKQFSELATKMAPRDADGKFGIDGELVAVQNERYPNVPKANEERLSTSNDDSNSSGSFKNATDQTQTTIDTKNDETMPDHHARRPMNAFLIFCKRHRGIVRERYPNLENR